MHVRQALRAVYASANCVLLLTISGCGGGGGQSSQAPTPTVTSVTVSPTTARVTTGTAATFSATVHGTGNFDRTVQWSVNGISGGDSSVGTIDSAGHYSSPTGLLAASTYTIKVASTQDLTKSGTAAVTVVPNPTIVISPQSVTLQRGQRQQFIANVTDATDTRVSWYAAKGQIDPTGAYTAPINTSITSDTITATSEANSDRSATAAVTLSNDSVNLASISPDRGGAGDRIILTVVDPTINGDPDVFFSGQAGYQIKAPGTFVSPGSYSVQVPAGAASGRVFIRALHLDGLRLDSNSLSFYRIPNIVLNVDRADVSSGDELQFMYAQLGDSAPQGVTWSVDQGSISPEGLYLAPAVTGDTTARIQACFDGTSSCDSFTVWVHPLQIMPMHPVVASGETVQLRAEVAGSAASAQWSVESGGGLIGNDGAYTAPTRLQDGGGVEVSATYGGSKQNAVISVTGNIPGSVNWLGEFGRHAWAITGRANRAYVAASKLIGGTTEFFLDTYDMSDAVHPRWLGAQELPFRVDDMRHYGTYLYALHWGSGNQADPDLFAIYEISESLPALKLVWNPWDYPGPPRTFYGYHDGKFFTVDSNVNGPSSITVYIVDLMTGIPQTSSLQLSLPSGVKTVGSEVLGDDNSLGVYVALTDSCGTGFCDTELLIYDTTTSPPALRTTWHKKFYEGFLALVNGALFTRYGIYDVSGTSPAEVGEFFLEGIEDVQGTMVLGRNRAGSIEIFDVSDPAHTRNVVSLAGHRGRRNAAFLENYVLGTEYPAASGFTVYDMSAPGGFHFKHSDYSSRNLLPYQHVAQPPYLYVGGATYGPAGALDIRDISGPVAVTVGSLNEPSAVFGIQVAGPIAYLGELERLAVVDVSTPSAPTIITTLPIRTSCLALNGTVLYAGTGDGNQLVVLDLTNPKNPTPVASVPIPDNPITMMVQNGFLYIADYNGGLLIYDVAVPSAPVLLSVFAEMTPVYDVAVDGAIALIAAGDVATIDISHPTAPSLLARQSMPYALSLALNDKVVYVGTEAYGCAVYGFDYTNPRRLRTVHLSTFGEILGYSGGGSVSVTSIGFWGTDVGVGCIVDPSTAWIQYDASRPRNVLDPSEASDPSQNYGSAVTRDNGSTSPSQNPTGDRRSTSERNPKVRWLKALEADKPTPK